MLTLTVLIENNSTRDDLIPAKGLSLLLEDGDDIVLLDTGTGSDFLRNAEVLGIQLGDINHVVLSHGHYDHAGGILSFFTTETSDTYMPSGLFYRAPCRKNYEWKARMYS